MFTASYLIVASSGTYIGKGISKSPKQAYSAAVNNCWDALCAGDAKAGMCSGIAVEQLAMYRNGKLIGSRCDM